MIYRIREYNIHPNKFPDFNYLFYHYLLPNQMKYGAKLIGRYINESHTKIIAIWEYSNKNQYEEIEQKIKQTDLHKRANIYKNAHTPLYISTEQSFWENTIKYLEEGELCLQRKDIKR